MTALRGDELIPCGRCQTLKRADTYCVATEERRRAMRRDIEERDAMMRNRDRHRTASERRADQRTAAEIFLGVRPGDRAATPILAAYF